MPQIDPVILQLRADVADYQNRLKATTVLVTQQLDRQERSIHSLEREVNASTNRIGNAFSSMGRAAVGFVSGFALGAVVKQLADLADSAKQIDAQLRLATSTFGTFGQAQEDVRRIANDTRGSLEATASLYGNFARATQQLGGDQTQAARATETFAKALKIGGADANAAASATLQFGQALASGALRGDEFNSIAEASPRIVRLIADAMGVTQGAVRALAAEGKLTSDVLFRALTDRRFTASIDAEFKQIPATFGDAMQALENAAITTFGQFDKGGRFSDAIVAFLGTGTDTFEGLSSKAEQFGIETRAVFDGFANLFDPLLLSGNSVFDALGVRIFSVRDQIQSLLDSFDKVANFDANIENAVKRGFNRAIDRAGGGKHFEETPLSQAGSRFRAGSRVSEARSRVESAARRLEGQGFVVPRNRDGSIDEAGIVRRPAAPRVRTTAPVSGGGGRRTRAAAGGGGNQVGRDAAKAETDLANLISAIRLAVADDSGFDKLGRPGSDVKAEQSAGFRRVFGKEGEDYDDPFAGVKDYDRERDARIDAYTEAERQAQDIREDNVRQLANTFEDLFRGGTDEVWRNFKAQGLRALALLLAQSAVSSFGKGGSGGGSFFGSIASGIGGIFSGNGSTGNGTGFGGLFGRASGGYMAPNSIARVNEGRGPELLRMGPQGGTVIPLGQTKAAQRQNSIVVQQTIMVDGRNSVTPAGFASSILEEADRRAGQAISGNNKALRSGFPGQQARYASLGTTG